MKDMNKIELDEYDTPRHKMPNCPVCDEDELAVIHKDYILCYNCGYSLTTSPPLAKAEGETKT